MKMRNIIIYGPQSLDWFLTCVRIGEEAIFLYFRVTHSSSKITIVLLLLNSQIERENLQPTTSLVRKLRELFPGLLQTLLTCASTKWGLG